MRFWDSSALVPLLTSERWTAALSELVVADPEIAVWWATPVECASAFARKTRSGEPGSADVTGADERLGDLTGGWAEIPPGDRLRERSIRLLRVHDLSAADALQLAAAIVASEDRPGTLEFVTLDDRLALAAGREGFSVVPS
jgi:predicted nucleic acid-binding protein